MDGGTRAGRPSTCVPELGDGPTCLGLGRGRRQQRYRRWILRAPGCSAGLPRAARELRGRAGGAGPGGHARSEVLYPAHKASPAGRRVRTGGGQGAGPSGGGADVAALWVPSLTDAAGQPGRTRAAAAFLGHKAPLTCRLFCPGVCSQDGAEGDCSHLCAQPVGPGL